jgi:hypothetical protein
MAPLNRSSQPAWLFGSAIFLASFLLFLVEPMAAKQLLPIFGGSAAVWITCLVFFQTTLLCAYLYAHALTRQPQSSARLIHRNLLLLAYIPALFWQFDSSPRWGNLDHPFLAILAALSTSIGLPFLVIGATSPLLQVWLARVETGVIRYHLFALSNLASLLALAAYPTLIEPNLNLRTQRACWTSGFAIFVLLCGYIAFKASPQSTAPISNPISDASASSAQSAPLAHKLLWLLLPMGAAMQLSAVTSHLTENVAAIPLLWILPLAVYLVTLILAFQFPHLLPRWIVTRFLVVMLAGLGLLLSRPEGGLPFRISILFFLAELFFACLFLHSEACLLRPQIPSEATLFYLLFAAGGALGSFLIGIASPMLFSFNYDLAISFFITAALAIAVLWSSGWAARLLWVSAAVLSLALIVFLNVAFRRNTPVAVRNFYGSLHVKQTVGYPGAVIRILSNGTIQHGSQIFSDQLRRTPTTYYAEDSGIGLAMHFCCAGRPHRIGVVGLGAGTLAAYGEAGDSIRFYEINPAVIPIAQNVFTYMRDATQRGAQIDIVTGDARTSLAQEPPQNFDILVIDAFSGDAIPLHLLTTQAVAIYKQHLAPGGVLAFHISNQHVDLEPEVALLAQAAQMKAMRITTPLNEERGEFDATWMLLSDSPTFFETPEVFNMAHTPTLNPKVRLWTDDYSSLLPILHW